MSAKKPAGRSGRRQSGPVSGPPPELLQAVELHQRGHLREAEALYAKIIQRRPAVPEALALYGYLAHQRGQDTLALARIDEALAAKPGMVDAHLWRGMALQRLQRPAEAAACFRQVLRLNPQHVDALNNLGASLSLKGDYAEAERLHRSAIALRPDRAVSHFGLGVALQRQGRNEAAAESLSRAVALRTDYVDAWSNLGVALLELRRSGKALEALERAAALDPRRPEIHLNLAKALHNLGRHHDTEAALLKALELYPEFAEARGALASTLQSMGRNRDAIAQLRYVRAVCPEYLTGGSSLAMKLMYETEVTPDELVAEHRTLGRAFVAAAGAPDPAWRRRDRNPDRRLRVGYVSPDFHAHSCAFFLEPLFGAHDPAAVELYAYSNAPVTDAVTERLRRLAPNWRDIAAHDDRQAAALVAEDRIDILVDCAGHTAHNRLGLFALKPAPLQGTWLGYPYGTGLPTVDFRITDAIVDPPGAIDAAGLERQIRLPDGFLVYRPVDGAPDPVPGPLERGLAPVLGCFNSAHKINAAVAGLWASILEAVPEARLKLRAVQFGDPQVIETYRELFFAAGVAADRMSFGGWAPTIEQGLADYANVDLALDPFPYNGTTTSCEALWMGVPVVTLQGATHAGRVGSDLLARVGLDELAAADKGDYRRIAVGLLRDGARLARWRRELRPRMAASPLCDAPRFARHLEAAYRALWREWCATGKEPPLALWDAPAPGVAVDAVRGEPATPESFVAPPASRPRARPTDKPVIRILHHMARSGGTLVAQCLGALPGVALLSEIHPDGVRFIDPLEQARDWYGLLDADEVAELSMAREGRFLEGLQRIEERARARGLALVLRDWSHLDLLGLPQLAAPTGRRRLVDALAPGFGILETCTVRHPIDQWESTRRLRALRGLLKLEDFMPAYRRFAELAAETGFLKFEDFAAAPEWGMRLLAERLNLSYDAVFLERWAANEHVTGDLPVRGNRRSRIEQPRRRPLEPGLLEAFARHPDYRPSLELLAYRHPGP